MVRSIRPLKKGVFYYSYLKGSLLAITLDASVTCVCGAVEASGMAELGVVVEEAMVNIFEM
jgi:hypothetical protein